MNILTFKRLYWLFKNRRKSPSNFARLKNCWQLTQLSGSNVCQAVEFLVVDCETSALEPSNGELLSIGWVVIKQQRIHLGTAEQYLFSPKETVGQSAVIHQLRDCDFNEGVDADWIMQRFLQAATGRVLVFHHAALDLAFLNRLSMTCCGAPLLMPVVDTLLVEQRQMLRRHQPMHSHSLQLAECRSRYHLPVQAAHDALLDALSTAELFLAQVALKGQSVRLKTILR